MNFLYPAAFSGGNNNGNNNGIPPVILNCPSSPVSVTAGSGATGAAVTWDPPSAIDNGATLEWITVSHSSGERFEIGTTEVTYIFRDEELNEAVCRFDVVVEEYRCKCSLLRNAQSKLNM